MNRIQLLCGAACALVVMNSGCKSNPKGSSEKDSMRQAVHKMESETLAHLYSVQPSAQRAIEGAAGYATFSNYGLKIFVAGSGSGKGVAVRNRTGEAIYMRMAEVQAGWGFGAKKVRLIWLFETNAAFDQFVNSGWSIGGQANASARLNDKGVGAEGAVPIAPGVWMYQLTESGLALELTAKGTKYYRDDPLN